MSLRSAYLQRSSLSFISNLLFTVATMKSSLVLASLISLAFAGPLSSRNTDPCACDFYCVQELDAVSDLLAQNMFLTSLPQPLKRNDISNFCNRAANARWQRRTNATPTSKPPASTALSPSSQSPASHSRSFPSTSLPQRLLLTLVPLEHLLRRRAKSVVPSAALCVM